MTKPFQRWLLVHFGFPIIVIFDKMFPDIRKTLDKWFVEYNNTLIKNNSSKVGGGNKKNILLLLPHCLQNDDCEHRLVKTILNCAQCGKCKISELVHFGEKYGIVVKVATGGRLAKRWVDEISPEIVVAVACERELTEGISGVYPIRVLGIPNKRPCGPCKNTTVEIDQIENYLTKFL